LPSEKALAQRILTENRELRTVSTLKFRRTLSMVKKGGVSFMGASRTAEEDME
jgi:hypothetical protein